VFGGVAVNWLLDLWDRLWVAMEARRAARAAREAEEGKRILEQAEKEARETWPPPDKPPPN
jgi:outer membrane protein TolC